MTAVRFFAERPGAAHRLVLFPHAGGSASFYRSWAADRPDTEVMAVQYPGRGDRLAEPLVHDMAELVAEAADDLGRLADGRPITVAGHSMGAVVAFETVRRLEAKGHRVRRLVASASRSPLDPDHVSALGTAWDDEAAVSSLAAMGQTDPELLTDSRVRAFLLPYLRADFELFQRYTYLPGPPLSCEVLAVHGDDDPHVPAARGALWRDVTTGPFAHAVLPGGHFYFADRPPVELFLGEPEGSRAG
ncbi:thioesterase II family protein [Streptomyces sp. NPDC057496]|uniref:thioesterase II family protein n=1 Tax=Streptomyces sp. NPDC057496 TaxID=3346149 RepID=UPI0036A6BC6C